VETMMDQSTPILEGSVERIAPVHPVPANPVLANPARVNPARAGSVLGNGLHRLGFLWSRPSYAFPWAIPRRVPV
jgi:hypothetical protein